MSGHTPTQLYVGTQNDGLYIIDMPPRPSNDDIGAGGATVIAKVYQHKDEDVYARLFAAAPELLDALRKLVAADAPEVLLNDDSDVWQAAHAAIAKAEGR